MNKLTKAAIAGAAGIALLMGGAGTLAYWNDSANLKGAAITAGNLTVEATDSPVWTDSNNVAIKDISAYRVVPGDTLTFTQKVTVVAQGDTLTAELGLSALAIQAVNSDNEADKAFAGLLEKSATFAISSGGTDGVEVLKGEKTVAFEPGTTTISAVLDLTVTITFPSNDDAKVDNQAKTGAVSLSNFSVVLTQTF